MSRHPCRRATRLVGVVLAAVLASTLLAARPSGALTTDLHELAAANQAAVGALKQRQLLELQRLEAAWAARITERTQAAQADRDRLAGDEAAALAPIAAKRDEQLAQVELDRQATLAAVPVRYAAEREQRRALIARLAGELAAQPSPLPKADADRIRAELAAQLKVELSSLDIKRRAALAAQQAELDTFLAAAKAQRDALAADQRVAAGDVTARAAALVTARTTQLQATLAQRAAEQADLDATYAGDVVQVKAAFAAEIADAKAARLDPKPIEARQKAKLDELKALYEQQTATIAAEVAAAKARAKLDISAIEAARDAELASLKVGSAERLKAFDAQAARTELELRHRIKQTDTSHAERADTLAGESKLRTAAAVRVQAELAKAASEALALVDRQEKDALDLTTKLAGEAASTKRTEVTATATAALVVAAAPFEQRRKDAEALLELDLRDLGSRREAAQGALKRRHARELLLATTDYQIMRSRVRAYLAATAPPLTGVDTYYDPATDQGSLYNVARTIGLDAGSPTGSGVKVALIDTGVVDVAGLAQADVTIGPDFSFEADDVELRGRDANGHGTHLAGIIVGRDEQWEGGDRTRAPGRFLGVAPDAQLIAIKAGTADGTTDVSQVIAAINWVIRYNQGNAADPIRVINLAYGTDSEQDHTLDPLSHAAERAWKAGIVVVVSAGNDGWDTERLSNPAMNPFVIAVGAAQRGDKQAVAAGYSSEGSADRGVDLVAPGRSIVSLRNPGSFSDTLNGGGRVGDRFVRGSGTSQAAAVVSGAVAVLLQQRPQLTPDEVKALLMASTNSVSGADQVLTGTGMLDVAKALRTRTIPSRQQWAPSTGLGSLEAARGTSHVVLEDGSVLAGEQDAFGQSYAADGWASDSWNGARWAGARWAGARWAGARWAFDGWEGARWAGARWAGARWAGARWAGDGWEGARWAGARWAGSGWYEVAPS